MDLDVAHAQLERLILAHKELLQGELQQDSQLLSSYRKALNELHFDFIKCPAPRVKRKTALTILNRTYKENAVSDYLAYILRPDENGIGSEPLVRTIRLVQEDFDLGPIESVEVLREQVLNVDEQSFGRIDLLINVGQDIVIGIENKIFQTEGRSQTKQYADAFERLFPGRQRILIFLTPSGLRPMDKRFKAVSYVDLFAALRNVNCPWMTDPHSSVLFGDFLIHLEDYIVTTKNAQQVSERGLLYFENAKMLMDLEKAFKQDKRNVFLYLIGQLSDHISDSKMDLYADEAKTFQQVRRGNWASKSLDVHFEYWFSVESLLSDNVQMMIDVEGKNRELFLAEFEKGVLPQVRDRLTAQNIEFRPQRRRNAIAWKEYSIESNNLNEKIELMKKTILQAWEDFAYLADYVDATFSLLPKDARL